MNNSGTLNFTREQIKVLIDEFDLQRENISKGIDETTLAIKNQITAYDKVTAQFNICKIHLQNFVDTFEAGFDRDPSQYHFNELADYVGAAEFLQRFGRTNNRISVVKTEMEYREVVAEINKSSSFSIRVK